MYNMLFPSFAKHKDIIQIYNYKIINELTKEIIHDSHESGRCVTKPKRHYKPFIQTLFRFKSCFPSIMLSNTDLMIPTTQIQFCKISCMFQLIKQIINMRKRIPVFNGDIVKGPIVNAHPPRPILLRNQDYRRATRRSAGPDDPLLNSS